MEDIFVLLNEDMPQTIKLSTTSVLNKNGPSLRPVMENIRAWTAEQRGVHTIDEPWRYPWLQGPQPVYPLCVIGLEDKCTCFIVLTCTTSTNNTCRPSLCAFFRGQPSDSALTMVYQHHLDAVLRRLCQSRNVSESVPSTFRSMIASLKKEDCSAGLCGAAQDKQRGYTANVHIRCLGWPAPTNNNPVDVHLYKSMDLDGMGVYPLTRGAYHTTYAPLVNHWKKSKYGNLDRGTRKGITLHFGGYVATMAMKPSASKREAVIFEINRNGAVDHYCLMNDTALGKGAVTQMFQSMKSNGKVGRSSRMRPGD